MIKATIKDLPVKKIWDRISNPTMDMKVYWDEESWKEVSKLRFPSDPEEGWWYWGLQHYKQRSA